MTTRTRLAAALRSGVWVAVTMVVSFFNLIFSRVGEADPTPYLYFSVLGVLTVPFVLIWRHRFPEIVMVITSVAAGLLYIGSSTVWVALGVLYIRREKPFWKDPWLWLSTVVATALTYLAVTRDTGTRSSEQSMIGIFFMEPEGEAWRETLPWYTEALTTVILMAMVLGVITIARARHRLKRVEHEAVANKEEAVSLTHELARFEERERIARELHDSLGSKLAAVSMLSGAMRAQSDDPVAVDSHARLLQHTAQEATSQMHEIVRTYRSATHPKAMRDIGELIASNQRHGMVIHSEINLDTDSPVAPAVDHAVYRVVQELLTNAAKHAPGYQANLRVAGGIKRGGVEIEANNPIPPRARTGPSSGGAASTGGAGLIGAAERVEHLGGWIATSSAGGTFRVHAWIPWRAPIDLGGGA